VSSVKDGKVFTFAGFSLDARQRLLFGSEGKPIPLTGRAFETLLYLLEHADELVDKQTLMKAVWPNVIVEENNLNQNVSIVRRALGEVPGEHRFIVTVPGRGFRFVALVQRRDALPAQPALAPERMASGGQEPAPPIVPPSLKATKEKEKESPHAHTGIATTGTAAVSSPSATLPAPPRSAKWVPLGWIGGALIALAGLAASWAITHYRGASKPAELTSSGIRPAIHSLVVLPLENLSGDKEQEYFADGMTDALTTDLAQIGSLRVISRTSAMQFKGSKVTLPQIGGDLKVDAVVEGTVFRVDNRVRITAQLVEASSDHHLWARTYERDLKDVLALQDEIAQDITEQIRIKLTPKERSLLIQVHAVDPEAYDAYLRGRYWFSLRTREGAWKAIDYYQKAIAKDPQYALAYANLAASLIWLDFKAGLPDAREAVAKALALDPSLAEAHTALGYIKFWFDWDWSGAEAEFKQATALNPNYARAHHTYSVYLVAMGRLDEAMKESERAQDLDPLSWVDTWWLGQVLYHARRYDDALRQNRRGLEMQSDRASFYDAMADVYEQKKMFPEAFAARQQALSLENDPSVTALGEAYNRSGYRGYLLKEAQVAEQAHNLPYAAHIYALLNDEARAMTALEAGYNERLWPILFLRTAPELDSIRSSPRFRALVRRIGFPQPSGDMN
jgi:TolB-like protein/DNA-binding winged helix-turn-helix (wHTH) protein